jgi:prepilin-type processing-associated H-X9-DG protein
MVDNSTRWLVCWSHSEAYWLALLVLFGLIVVASRARDAALRRQAAGDGAGRRRATALRWVAGLAMAPVALAFAAGLFHFGCARAKAADVTCISNLKQISYGLLMYSQYYDERFPPAASWGAVSGRHVVGGGASPSRLLNAGVYRCPEAPPGMGYGFNRAMGGVDLAKMDSPAETILLFEANARTRSFAGGPGDVAWNRHGGMPKFAFADGHVKSMRRRTVEARLWRPAKAPARTNTD